MACLARASSFREQLCVIVLGFKSIVIANLMVGLTIEARGRGKKHSFPYYLTPLETLQPFIKQG